MPWNQFETLKSLFIIISVFATYDAFHINYLVLFLVAVLFQSKWQGVKFNLVTPPAIFIFFVDY